MCALVGGEDDFATSEVTNVVMFKGNVTGFEWDYGGRTEFDGGRVVFQHDGGVVLGKTKIFCKLAVVGD